MTRNYFLGLEAKISESQGHVVIPSARRLITSLRDMGYDFVQAVADVIDNSIEGQASNISIMVEFDGDNSWVTIADDGIGMSDSQLQEAMRFGSDREYDEDALGKFGLGLKTASISQCQRLSVASRSAASKQIAAYAWDLEHISKTNRWEILTLQGTELKDELRAPLKRSSGTVVMWERLDRILGYKKPYGVAARKKLAQMCHELEQHLGMVFHRFLSGSTPGKRISISINGNLVGPWDPYCQSESNVKKLDPVRIDLEHEGVIGNILLQPFVLPRQDQFSSQESFRNARGPASWNQQQGFYIYRSGRMIQSGGWSNLRAPDEHTKLARIAVSFTPFLDEAFKINVAKMRVQLPAQVRDSIREIVAPIVKLARDVYDGKEQRSPTTQPREPRAPTPKDTPKNEIVPDKSRKSATPPTRGTDRVPKRDAPESNLHTVQEWLSLLSEVATKKERRTLKGVVAKYLGKKG